MKREDLKVGDVVEVDARWSFMTGGAVEEIDDKGFRVGKIWFGWHELREVPNCSIVPALCVPSPAARTVPCERCKKLDHEKNHPVGMIFVGWGHGWQPCPHCGGSGVVPVVRSGEAECLP